MHHVKQEHIPNFEFTSHFSGLVIIRPIYNGKALRYCWEECVCLLLGVLQTNSRAQSKSLFWWSLPCWWTRENWLLTGGWDIGLHDRQSFGPQSTVWEPEALHLRHTPFIQVKQDYWNDRQVCNLGTRSWFRPIKLQVTESSQWRTAVRH